MGSRIRVGDVAPDFAARSHRGTTIRLSQFYGHSTVVLYFYPWDNSPICTEQARCFTDSHTEFTAVGATVLGVSGDGPVRHRSFASKLNLPFSLLSDETGEIRRLYGIPRKFGMIPGRVTFVIDRRGAVADVFIAQFQAEQHVERALRVVQDLEKSSESSQAASSSAKLAI